MSWLTEIRCYLRDHGLIKFQRYYSFYLGEVVDNDDPEKNLRIKLKCKSVYGNTSPEQWVPLRTSSFGVVWPPSVGQKIWVRFQEGDPRFPFWEPYMYDNKTKAPETEDYPKTYGFITRKGNHIKINDEEGKISIKTGDSEVLLEGSKISLLRGNQKVVISSDGFTLKKGNLSLKDVLQNFQSSFIESQLISKGLINPLDWNKLKLEIDNLLSNSE